MSRLVKGRAPGRDSLPAKIAAGRPQDRKDARDRSHHSSPDPPDPVG